LVGAAVRVIAGGHRFLIDIGGFTAVDGGLTTVVKEITGDTCKKQVFLFLAILLHILKAFFLNYV
jgi:hypothetical protein